jgi:hypothetical protein
MVLPAAVGTNPGKHGDVVNSFQGQWGGVAHRGGCYTAVGDRPKEAHR